MSALYIKQARIYTPQDVVDNGAVLVADGSIQAVGPTDALSPPPDAQLIEARGQLLVPGFIDLQLNGAFDCDFTQEPRSIWSVARRLPRYGVTAFLPTVITSPLSTVAQAQEVLSRRPPDFTGAAPLGLHLEGPFLSPAKKGAHNPAHLRLPALSDVDGWTAGQGVRLVTLAPELPGALAVVAALVNQGVIVSAGHSESDYTKGLAGIDAGIRYGTHLFNAMPLLHHRQPGLAGALLTDERVTIGLIADGIHVHPSLVKMVWQAAGRRLNLVTDAMGALGMPPGRYRLGDQEVVVIEAEARLADGTLAGSILSLDAALRNLMTFTGCSLPDALATVTTTPAALLGLSARKGQIAPGYDADLVLLTPELEIVTTLVGGDVVYQADSGGTNNSQDNEK